MTSLRLPTALVLLGLICSSLPAEMISISQWSDAVSAQATFEISVPDAEPPVEGWPVLYLLHGAWGSHSDWWANTDVEELADELGILMVFPDGGQFGWYLDSPMEPDSQYESRIINEIVPLVDRSFRVRRDREGRGICGLSMGGHGAISLAAKHPDLFGSASSLSGAFVLVNHPEPRFQLALRLGSLEEHEENWTMNQCLNLADRLVDADVRLMFDSGVDDTLVIEDNRAFRQRLLDLGVEHEYTEYPGTHSWDYWSEHIGEHVRWHAEGFGD